MAFIRVKKVKAWKYAYLVENSWKGSRTRQKVKQYLGRVHNIEKCGTADTPKDIEKLSYRNALAEIIRAELEKNGFEGKKLMMRKGDFAADLEKMKFSFCGKPAVISANEGFICDYTFRKVAEFRPYSDEDETALRLAEAIVEAGLKINTETFVKMFEKLQKPAMPEVIELAAIQR